MNEFIFPINKVFSKEQDSVLGLNSSQCYYIAPYQRGYKWGSSTRFEQVPQMLIDIYDAMNNGTSQYYLQYITVKRTEFNKKKVLEIIDGQQRLTTLSLLYYQLKNYIGINPAEGIIIYARYNSSQSDIFDSIEENINKNITSDEIRALPTQDEYYMTNAALAIKNFLLIAQKHGKLTDFVQYLEQNVMLIVNIESEFIDSEQVFVNLNDNKVPLTDNYLIKGLLLTNAVERNNTWGIKKNYKEILDQRCIMGRTWDEIMMWISKPDIAHYFFGQSHRNEGMYYLLSFVYDLLFETPNPSNSTPIIDEFVNSLTRVDNPNTTDSFPLFNKYNEVVSNAEIAITVLNKLKHVYLKFRSLYDNYSDCFLYNLFGFVLFSENIGIKTNPDTFRKERLKELVNLGTKDFTHALLEKAILLTPDMESCIIEYKNNHQIETKDLSDDDLFKALTKFHYKSKNEALKNLLLSFSVFPEENSPSYRFDFCQYDIESWSFEHIFPQNPPQKLKVPPVAVDIVCRAIDSEITNTKDVDRKSSLKNISQLVKNNKVLNKEEINEISFLYDCKYDIDLCGNMALLSQGVNSMLSNNPFIAKRPILLSKVNEGSFVPQHTMNVFNKILATPEGAAFVPELSKWTRADVIAHIKWQIQRNISIRKQLQKDYEHREI